MKTIVAVAVCSVLAVVLIEISTIDAKRPKECDEKNRPPLNTTEVVCDEGGGQKRGKCARECRACYEKEDLTGPGGCLVEGVCTCLAKGEEGGEESTTAASTDPPATEDTTVPA